MASIALKLLGWLWPYLLGAVVLGVGYYTAEHWCNSVCKDARAEVVALKAEKVAAQERATALALLWSAQVSKTEEASRTRETVNATVFAGLKNDAGRAAVAGGVRFSPESVRVFDSARSAVETPGASPLPVQTAPAPAASAEVYVVQLHEWAATCKARVEQWEGFYAGLRSAEQPVH